MYPDETIGANGLFDAAANLAEFMLVSSVGTFRSGP